MASRYKLIEYDSEEERLRDPEGPPTRNLFAAGRYIDRLLAVNGIPYAFMGGFAMICRGSRRPTRDIDVAVKTDMRTIWTIIEPQSRLVIPDTKLVEGIIKIFVKTGEAFGDDVILPRLIEVDLVMPGNKGTPLELSSNSDMLSVNLSGGVLVLPGLNVLYMMKTKLAHCLTRGMQRDFEDILFLFTNYQTDVQRVSTEVSPADRTALLELDGFRRLAGTDLNQFRTILRL